MVQQRPESTCLTLPFLHKTCGTQWQGTAKAMLDKGGKDGVGQVRQEARVGARSWNHLSWGRSLPSLPEAELTFPWLPVQDLRLHRTWHLDPASYFYLLCSLALRLLSEWAMSVTVNCCQRVFPIGKKTNKTQNKTKQNPKYDQNPSLRFFNQSSQRNWMLW